MTSQRIGLIIGTLALLATIFLPAPAGMPREAWIVAGLVVLMAAWWMTEAIPLTATALMPFLVLPFAGVLNAERNSERLLRTDPVPDPWRRIYRAGYRANGAAPAAIAGDPEDCRQRRRAIAFAARLYDLGRAAFDADFEHLHIIDHDADGAGRLGGRRTWRPGLK